MEQPTKSFVFDVVGADVGSGVVVVVVVVIVVVIVVVVVVVVVVVLIVVVVVVEFVGVSGWIKLLCTS